MIASRDRSGVDDGAGAEKVINMKHFNMFGEAVTKKQPHRAAYAVEGEGLEPGDTGASGVSEAEEDVIDESHFAPRFYAVRTH